MFGLVELEFIFGFILELAGSRGGEGQVMPFFHPILPR
jgi:hypothetical protein